MAKFLPHLSMDPDQQLERVIPKLALIRRTLTSSTRRHCNYDLSIATPAFKNV